MSAREELVKRLLECSNKLFHVKGTTALLREAAAALSESAEKRTTCCGEWDTLGDRCPDCPWPRPAPAPAAEVAEADEVAVMFNDLQDFDRIPRQRRFAIASKLLSLHHRLYASPRPEGSAKDGWRLVPEKATAEMLEAWADEGLTVDELDHFAERYEAMLAAAPPAEDL